MSATDSEQRSTRQKSAIRSAFEGADRPLSPQQVLQLAQTEVGGLGIATVYRNIKALLEVGWLSAVELPGGAVHSFIDGLAIATAFSVTHEAGLATTIAVILHEVPHH
ncbi:MAG TPA: ZIP family metal transporter, partial [Bryobacteraceae bacterium]